MSGALSGARVLVTGGEGFTGRHLIAAARTSGADVASLSRSAVPNADFPIHLADICDADKVAAAVKATDPTHIVHLAAISATRREDEEIYQTVNVQGTANLLDAARHYAPSLKHISLASSAAVYGNPGPELVSEDRSPTPANAYGQSKLDMEKLAVESGLPTLCFRPFNYTGPAQPDHFIVPKLVKAFADKVDEIELWETVSIREFWDVRDAVAAYIALMADEVTGVLNLCSGHANSVGDVIETFKKITQHNPKITTTGTAGGLLKLVGDPTKLHDAGAPEPQYQLEDTLRFMLERA